MGEEKSVLRWGGLAGMLGGVVLILTFVIRIGFVGADPADPEGLVTRFPNARLALTVEDGLYLVAVLLWVTLFLALYRALRGTSLAPALFGSVLGILGLVVLAIGALPHIAFAPISDLYHAPGATPEEQTTLVFLWQATQGMLDALLAVGLFLLAVGIVVLGLGMLGTPAFGKGYGGASVALGVVALVAASISLVDVSPIFAIGIFAVIAFHLALGWKAYGMSRAAT